MRRVLALTITFFLFQKAHCQSEFRNPDVPMSNEFRQFSFIHIISKATKDSNVDVGEVIGTVEHFPEKLSEKFDAEIKSSMDYYDKKNFQKARTVLDNAIASEPDNPFILNAYARACYQIDKITSYTVYKKLIGYLDSETRSTSKEIAVDVWFTEAYWKLGTLHMDNKEWRKASFEISRFMMSIGNMKGEFIYEQALEYLTECYYTLYEDKTAAYLAKRLLTYNPQNEYAKKVLAEIK